MATFSVSAESSAAATALRDRILPTGNAMIEH
jgi:hypothetical protein